MQMQEGGRKLGQRQPALLFVLMPELSRCASCVEYFELTTCF